MPSCLETLSRKSQIIFLHLQLNLDTLLAARYVSRIGAMRREDDEHE